jgi:hypothetical protein
LVHLDDKDKTVFEKYALRSHVLIIFTVCAFLKHQARQLSEEVKKAINACVDQMLHKAQECVKKLKKGTRIVS